MELRFVDNRGVSGMRLFCRLCLPILLPAVFACCGLAQSSTITTYAGPPSPVNGAQATTYVFGPLSAVVPDGAGGFYFLSDLHKRIYRVAASGTVRAFATGSGLLAVDAAGNLFITDSGRIQK